MWALTTPEGQKETLGAALGLQSEFGVSLLRAEQRHPGQVAQASKPLEVATPS
jgi:hypothetical protein